MRRACPRRMLRGIAPVGTLAAATPASALYERQPAPTGEARLPRTLSSDTNHARRGETNRRRSEGGCDRHPGQPVSDHEDVAVRSATPPHKPTPAAGMRSLSAAWSNHRAWDRRHGLGAPATGGSAGGVGNVAGRPRVQPKSQDAAAWGLPTEGQIQASGTTAPPAYPGPGLYVFAAPPATLRRQCAGGRRPAG